MVVRDLFFEIDVARVIARAIYEDNLLDQDLNGWITKYYSQLIELRESNVQKMDTMFYLSVVCREKKPYGNVSGIEYDDIKLGIEKYYAIEVLDSQMYASLFVPGYTVKRYGKEVVAAEALREYGWNGYDKSIICPNKIREQVFEYFENIETGVFQPDKNYRLNCIKEFETFMKDE